ncbi:MAG TPA: hypothetical protein VM843_04655 [Flavisolibacter sp.]|nr:hypothetical protein [Flavisolibacter sp.]
MNKALLLCALFSLNLTLHAQQISLENFIDFSTLPPQKFNSVVAKKDFRQVSSDMDGRTSTYQYLPSKSKGDPMSRTITVERSGNILSLAYKTTSPTEFAAWMSEAKKASFKSSGPSKAKGTELFQLNNMCLQAKTETLDSVATYIISLDVAQLPRPREIVFAEDLLAYNSHERLAYAFGESNVSKDVFYYDEKDPNQCTVLFPNTAREVIFIWSDETNYKDISFLIVGGHLRTAGTQKFTRGVEQSLWQSKQGVYAGMGLLELQLLNQKPIDFYSWQTEEAGMIVPRNKGLIDFSKLGLVLNCLNCAGSSNGGASIVNSERELAEGRKVYVSTMIILPQKEAAATASVSH